MSESMSESTNPAVARCLHAFSRVYKTNLSIGQTRFAATQCAASAFRNVMPPLDGHDNIRNFIACVAQGILVGAIQAGQSSSLLYAAQVALSADRFGRARPKAAKAA